MCGESDPRGVLHSHKTKKNKVRGLSQFLKTRSLSIASCVAFKNKTQPHTTNSAVCMCVFRCLYWGVAIKCGLRSVLRVCWFCKVAQILAAASTL